MKYGNNSMTGRKTKAIVRQKASKKKAIKAKEVSLKGNELVIAQDLMKSVARRKLWRGILIVKP